jgi:multidrug efflux pump subunit AcrB
MGYLLTTSFRHSQRETPSVPRENINLDGKYPIVPVNAIVSDIKDLEGIALKRGPNGTVFVRDVATVEDAADVVTSYALANGRRTVYLPVTKRGDASTVETVNLVKKIFRSFRNFYPMESRSVTSSTNLPL